MRHIQVPVHRIIIVLFSILHSISLQIYIHYLPCVIYYYYYMNMEMPTKKKKKYKK